MYGDNFHNQIQNHDPFGKVRLFDDVIVHTNRNF